MKKVLVLLAMAFVLSLTGCAGDVYVEAPASVAQPPGENLPPVAVGTATVAMAAGGSNLQIVPFWFMNVTLLTFHVAMSDVEDGEIELILPEFYASAYQELVPISLLQNVRLIAEDGTQVSINAALLTHRPAGPENGWKDTTYTCLPTKAVVTKGTMRTFRVVADTGWSWVNQVTTTLPDAGSGMFAGGIGDHVIIRGASSGEIMEVRGEASGMPTFFYDPYSGGKG